MCELLGMSANVPTDICFSFSGLIERAGRTGPHKDGWGIAFYEHRGCRIFKDPLAGSHSRMAEIFKSYPIKSRTVISHIRKANRGRICSENTHPFSRELWGQDWCFAHNGQLKGIKRKTLRFYHPIGTTDSEHAFCWLMDQVRTHHPRRPGSQKNLRLLIETCARELAGHGVFNMMLSDATHLYVYCGSRMFTITRKAPFGSARLTDKEMAVDFAKETSATDVVTVIATQPLTTNESWSPLPKDSFAVFSQGRRNRNSPH